MTADADADASSSLTSSSSPILDVHGLTCTLPNGKKIFSDISITLPAANNPCLVVIGPSGCGKTTLLKAIAMLCPCDSRVMTLNGRSMQSYGPMLWRSNVLYVSQVPALHTGTPRDLWETVCSINSQKYRQLRHHHLVLTSPMDYGLQWKLDDLCWDREWNVLSGGERQRCALAIVLATQPKVLLLDEPTSALDFDTALLVEKSLKQFPSVWVTHSDDQQRRVATNTLLLSTSSRVVSQDNDCIIGI